MSTEPILETLLVQAEGGQRSAIESFLYAFLQETIFVPERHQTQPLSDQPRYPNDLFYVLGIQSKELVIIPAFTRPEMIVAWCGNPLTYKSITGQELCQLAPENWWIIINPDSDLAKEFSPWEISQLKAGSGAVPEVADDIAAELEVENLKVRPLQPDELTQVTTKLIETAKQQNNIDKVFILVEEHNTSADSDADTLETLLLGIMLTDASQINTDELQDQFDRLLKPLLIGSMPTKIFIFDAQHNAMAGRLFLHFPAIYSAQLSL